MSGGKGHDVDQQQASFAQTYRQEAEELLGQVEEAILDLEDDHGNQEAIHSLFRAIHTLKGSGGMFGFTAVESFTHHLETALEEVRSGSADVTRELIDLILASQDHIRALITVEDGDPPAEMAARGASLLETLRELMPGGGDGAAAPTAEADADAGGACGSPVIPYEIHFRPSRGVFAQGMDPALLLAELKDLGPCEVIADQSELPALAEMDPEQCYLAWTVMLQTDAGEDAIRDVFIFVEDDCDLTITPLLEPEVAQQLAEIPDAEPAARASGDQKQDATPTAGTAARSVRVPSDRLDSLINLVGELVITQSRLSQIAGNLDDVDLDISAEDVERLTGELRDLALSIRMMPIGSTFSRFRRLVRDLSGQLGKSVELITEGAETEMDKTIIDRLTDPLVHLIRNSIDHGMEDPDERQAAGKEPTGRVRLAAAHRGTNVVITIEDDGRGLQADKIRAKAVAKGLIAPDADLDRREIFQLIMAPGFSTAAEVTNVSGRGVGMDVVRREIDALRGKISIDSTPGQGTRIDLALPLTLAIIDGLLVEVAGERFVVPVSMVEECLEIGPEHAALGNDRDVLSVRGSMLPFVRLRDFYGLRDRAPALEEAVVVRLEEQRLGIVVDRVIGDHQTVIKSLGKLYEGVESISGATIMGDGEVALILDIMGLVRSAHREEAAALAR